MTRQEIVSLRIRRAVTKDVGLAGVLLYVPVLVHENEAPAAWTDGMKMHFGAPFFEFSEQEQVGVCVHECLHVVFRHVQRGRTIYEREGSAYRADFWNLACDAVINHCISQLSWASLPKDAVDILALLGSEALKAKPAHLWTSEQTYEALKERPCTQSLRSSSLAADLSPGSRPFDAASMRSAESGPQTDRHQTAIETRIWRERIVRAQAGSHPGGLLRKLSADIPRSRIRWELVLREFLNAHCLPKTESSWARPSRRTLAHGQHAKVLEAGVERKKGITRIGVVVDTSGSIDSDVLSSFIAEINAIMRATGAETVVVDCDAAVHSVTVFRRPLADYQPKGGGGTDFRPGVAELEKLQVTAGVYLTDLCGTFPERAPRFPLLWTVTQDLTVPFGRKVLIPQK